MPNEPKWTPGPWEAIPGDVLSEVRIAGGGEYTPITYMTLGSHAANAHLIAAAPDMAQALEGLISAVTEGGALDQARALFAASAALEKAKGGAA